MELLSDKNKTVSLQDFKNPFGKDGVEYVRFSFHKKPSFMRNNHLGEATIYFKKGNTSGEQTFYSNGFQDLVKQVDTFINTLK
ncbi:MAG: hypothetical protein WCJ62_07500 [Flavobacterium sp.]